MRIVLKLSMIFMPIQTFHLEVSAEFNVIPVWWNSIVAVSTAVIVIQ